MGARAPRFRGRVLVWPRVRVSPPGTFPSRDSRDVAARVVQIWLSRIVARAVLSTEAHAVERKRPFAALFLAAG